MGPLMNLRQPCLHVCQDMGAMVLLRHSWSLPSPLSPLYCLGPPVLCPLLKASAWLCLLSPPHPSTFTPGEGLLPLPQCEEPRGLWFCVRGPAGL